MLKRVQLRQRYSGYVADPDGHLWEIAWNPHLHLTAQGELALP